MESPITLEQTNTLNKILENDLLESNKLDKKHFRNKHYEYIAELDFIEQREIVRTNHDTNEYELTSVSLALCNSGEAKQLFSDIDQVCDYLKSCYQVSMNEAVLIDTLIKEIDLPEKRIHHCLFYVHGENLAQREKNKELNTDSVRPNERLRTFSNFSEIPKSYLPSWFPDWNPEKKKELKPHGNAEVNALKQVQILEAALAILAAYHQECLTSSGQIQGSKISKLIELNSEILFPDNNSEPPLGNRRIAEIVNTCLRISKKLK